MRQRWLDFAGMMTQVTGGLNVIDGRAPLQNLVLHRHLYPRQPTVLVGGPDGVWGHSARSRLCHPRAPGLGPMVRAYHSDGQCLHAVIRDHLISILGGDHHRLRNAIFNALSVHWERRRSEEHTSELQSQSNLVCRLLLEQKKMSTHATN